MRYLSRSLFLLLFGGFLQRLLFALWVMCCLFSFLVFFAGVKFSFPMQVAGFLSNYHAFYPGFPAFGFNQKPFLSSCPTIFFSV